MAKHIKYTVVSLSNLVNFVENKLSKKYEYALQGLEKRFTGLFSIFRVILNCCLELSEQFQRSSQDSTNVRPLIDNIIHLINEIVLEFPIVLDYDYCESFLSSIQQRLELIFANFHPLIHIASNDSRVNSNLEFQTRTIGAALNKTHDYVFEIQNRFESSLPLLKRIQHVLKLYKEPSSLLMTEIKGLKDIEKFKEEYDLLKTQLENYPDLNEFPPVIHRLKDQMKTFNEIESEFEYYIEHVIKLCYILKSKGKKLLREEGRDEYRDLMSYVNLLVKTDFEASCLADLENTEDLIEAIMHLESQKAVVNELKKEQPFKSDLESIRLCRCEDLRRIIDKWKQAYSSILEIENSEEYKTTLNDFLLNKVNPIEDLRRLEDKLRSAKRAIAVFLKVNCWFSKFRYKVAKSCLEEFNERIELIWPE